VNGAGATGAGCGITAGAGVVETEAGVVTGDGGGNVAKAETFVPALVPTMTRAGIGFTTGPGTGTGGVVCLTTTGAGGWGGGGAGNFGKFSRPDRFIEQPRYSP